MYPTETYSLLRSFRPPRSPDAVTTPYTHLAVNAAKRAALRIKIYARRDAISVNFLPREIVASHFKRTRARARYTPTISARDR